MSKKLVIYEQSAGVKASPDSYESFQFIIHAHLCLSNIHIIDIKNNTIILSKNTDYQIRREDYDITNDYFTYEVDIFYGRKIVFRPISVIFYGELRNEHRNPTTSLHGGALGLSSPRNGAGASNAQSASNSNQNTQYFTSRGAGKSQELAMLQQYLGQVNTQNNIFSNYIQQIHKQAMQYYNAYLDKPKIIPKSAPARFGEIITFRNWKVENGMLRSVYTDKIWAPKEPMTGDIDSFGVHAWKNKQQAIDYAQEYKNSGITMPIILGQVMLYGEVIEAERGYVASHAVIKSLDMVIWPRETVIYYDEIMKSDPLKPTPYLENDIIKSNLDKEKELLNKMRKKYGVK